MRSHPFPFLLLTGNAVFGQGLDLRSGLPAWGTFPVKTFYTAVPEATSLRTDGTSWTWDLTAASWELGTEGADTVWHHMADVPPAQGGPFSTFEMAEQRFSFYHFNGDTLVEDSAWSVTQGTTEVGYPPIPLCWYGQAVGDTLWYFDEVAGMKRFTTLRATLDLKMPWGQMDDLLVFEDRILDFITYRIHRREDLVRELARYAVGDGLYARWPAD